MEPASQCSEKPAHKPFIRKMRPLSTITSPTQRQSGMILPLPCSGMFSHAKSWMCVLPKKNARPAMMNRTPKKIEIDSVTDHTFL